MYFDRLVFYGCCFGAVPVDSKKAARAALAAKKLERDMKAQADIVWKTHDDIKKYLTTKDVKCVRRSHGNERLLSGLAYTHVAIQLTL